MTTLDNRPQPASDDMPSPSGPDSPTAWWLDASRVTADALDDIVEAAASAYEATCDLLRERFGASAQGCTVAAPIESLVRLGCDLTTFAYAFDALWVEDDGGMRVLRAEYTDLSDIGLIRLAGARLTAYLLAVPPSAQEAFEAWCSEEGFETTVTRVGLPHPAAMQSWEDVLAA